LRSNGLSPDLNAPPRKDEPTSKAPTGKTTLAADDLSFDAEKSKTLLTVNLLPASPPPPPAPALPPPPPEVLWGRWQPIANLPADSEALAKLKSGRYEAGSVVESCFI
jgi:hypothetical protein